MKSIIITSNQAREGKTTLAVNLLAACLDRGWPARLLDLGSTGSSLMATSWMDSAGLSAARACYLPNDGGPGLLTDSDSQPLEPDAFLIVDLDCSHPAAQDLLLTADDIILAVRSCMERVDFAALAAWDQALAGSRGTGFGLIVPNLYDPREWERNEQFLDRLSDTLGWDRIANPVPH